MKRLFIFVLMGVFSSFVSLTSSDYFRIYFNGQSKNLLSLYQAMNLNSDEVIVYFIYPNAAPRLETLINDSYQYIKKLNFTGDIIGVINYPKYWYAKNYEKKMGFPFKCIIDTTFSFFSELTNMNPIVPPLLLRFDKKGYIKNQICLYGVNLSSQIVPFIKDLDTITLKIEKRRVQNGFDINEFANLPRLQPNGFWELNEDSVVFLDLIYSFKVDPMEKFLFLNGRGSFRWEIYKVSKDAENFEIVPELSIRKFFSPDFDSLEFLDLEKNFSYAKSMFMDGFFVGDSLFIILSVLPQISVKISNSDTIYYASTRFAFLHYNYYLRKVQKFIPINLEQLPNYFGVAPYTPLNSVNRKTREVALMLHKGYPTVGFAKPNDTSFVSNPFSPSFYDFAPLFCTFNFETGELIRYLGNVGQSHAKLAAGYFMCMPLVAFDEDGHYYLYQNLSDFVETDTCLLKIKPYFEESLLAQNLKPVDSLPDITFYYLISDSTKGRIEYMKTYKNKLILLWRLKEKNKTLNDSEILLLQIYNIDSKTLEKEYILPYSYDGLKFSTYFFSDKKPYLFALYYNSRKTIVVKYVLPFTL